MQCFKFMLTILNYDLKYHNPTLIFGLCSSYLAHLLLDLKCDINLCISAFKHEDIRFLGRIRAPLSYYFRIVPC